jgi:hypothetical protein
MTRNSLHIQPTNGQSIIQRDRAVQGRPTETGGQKVSGSYLRPKYIQQLGLCARPKSHTLQVLIGDCRKKNFFTTTTTPPPTNPSLHPSPLHLHPFIISIPSSGSSSSFLFLFLFSSLACLFASWCALR